MSVFYADKQLNKRDCRSGCIDKPYSKWYHTDVKKILLVVLASVGLYLLIQSSVNVYNNTQAKPVEVVKNKYQVGEPTVQELLELVNKERAKSGVSALKLKSELTASAQYKASDMAERGYFGHKAPGTNQNNGLDYLNKTFTGCSWVSENLVGDATTSISAVLGWKKSLPHLRAMLDKKYALTGFGVALNKDGTYSVVEHFCVVK